MFRSPFSVVSSNKLVDRLINRKKVHQNSLVIVFGLWFCYFIHSPCRGRGDRLPDWIGTGYIYDARCQKFESIGTETKTNSETVVEWKHSFFKKNWICNFRRLDFSLIESNSKFIHFQKWISFGVFIFSKIFRFFREFSTFCGVETYKSWVWISTTETLFYNGFE